MMIATQENSPTTLRFSIAVPALIAASFANLQFLPVWSEFADPRSANSFFLPEPALEEFMAALVAYAILSVVALCGYKLACRSWSRGAKRLFAALLCLSLLNPLTLNGLILFDRVYFLPFRELLAGLWFPALIAGIVAFLAAAVWVRPEIVLRVFKVGLLVLSPFAIISMGNAAWAVVSTPGKTTQGDKYPNAGSNKESRPRVMWIIFDELDQHAVFEAPPKRFAFPALRRLYEESFAATRVNQAGANTITAVPGMTTGRQVSRSSPAGKSNLELTFAEEKSNSGFWRETPNLFKALAEKGRRLGLIGGYFPYCRLFGEIIQTCKEIRLGTTRISDGGTFLDAVFLRLNAVNFFYRRVNAIQTYKIFLQQAKTLAVDPELDFSLVHIPIPHQPTIYDGIRKKFTAFNFRKDGYLHNVLVADRFLAEIRSAMENAGIWKKTTVVVSSDHGWRAPTKEMHNPEPGRIPFIVKLSGTPSSGKYIKPLDAVLFKNFFVKLTLGEIADTGQLMTWLDLQSSTAK